MDHLVDLTTWATVNFSRTLLHGNGRGRIEGAS